MTNHPFAEGRVEHVHYWVERERWRLLRTEVGYAFETLAQVREELTLAREPREMPDRDAALFPSFDDV